MHQTIQQIEYQRNSRFVPLPVHLSHFRDSTPIIRQWIATLSSTPARRPTDQVKPGVTRSADVATFANPASSGNPTRWTSSSALLILIRDKGP